MDVGVDLDSSASPTVSPSGGKLRPIPKDRLKHLKCVKALHQAPNPEQPSRTQELHLEHDLPCRAPEELEEFDLPDVRKTAVLTETIKRLRNENWHLLCEMDLLKLALQSQKDNYPRQTPAHLTNYNQLQCMADQQLEEMRARCRASEEEVLKLKRVVRNCEAECKAWATLHQSIMEKQNDDRRRIDDETRPAVANSIPHNATAPTSSPPPAPEAPLHPDQEGVGQPGKDSASGTDDGQSHAGAERRGQATAGAKALFGTINNLIFQEEQLLCSSAPPAVLGAYCGQCEERQGGGCPRSSKQRDQARGWLNWWDREKALKTMLLEKDRVIADLKLAQRRSDVALRRSDRERESAELERAEERERERELYVAMETELRAIQQQFRLLKARDGDRAQADGKDCG